MGRGDAIFLYSRTPNMAIPWAEAGYRCFCVDTAHSIRRERVEGNIHFVWGDARVWRPPHGVRPLFVAAFPPCTETAVCGARDFLTKGGMMLRDALETFESARQVCAWSGAPYCIEQPITMLVSVPHIGKPDFYFNPNEYAGYSDDPQADAYTKKTAIWCGNDFVIPPARPVTPDLGSRMHMMPPSDDRADLRAVTPMGFSRAVFQANAPHLRERTAA